MSSHPIVKLSIFFAILFAKPRSQNMDKNVEEDCLSRLRHLKKRQNELMKLYLVILSMLLVSYVFGFLGFSSAWVVIIAFITFLIWKKRVMRMNEVFLREQEFYIAKKRTLKHNESCEWLNLIVNRWFVFTSKNFSEIFKTKIDMLIDILKPDFINSLEFKSINIQTGTPQFKEIYSFEIIHANNKRHTIQSPDFISSLSNSQKYQLVVEASVEMHCQHLMTMAAVLSGKWRGLSLDVGIEDFSMVGRIQIHINMDKDTPFPHISSLSFSFPQKPDIHFGIRVLRHFQLMQIPFLKMWLHSLVSNTLLEAFVDPGKFEYSLKHLEATAHRPSIHPSPNLFAVGVLSVNVTGSIKPSGDKKNPKAFEQMNEQKYLEISLGKQNFSTHPQSSSSGTTSSPSSFSSSTTSSDTLFTYVVSFFVYNLNEEILKVDLMSQMFLSRLSLTSLHTPLSSLNLDTNFKVELSADEKLERSNEKVHLDICLKYTPLEDVKQVIQNAPKPDLNNTIESGVLSVCIHGASDVLGLDPDGESDPYCLFYSSGKKICTTHYLPRTRNPKWESYSQLIVEDISKVVLSFVVYDWDGVSMSEDDFLGSTHISMAKDKCPIIHHLYPLLPTYLDTQFDPNYVTNRGHIFVSVIFTPMPHIPSQAIEKAIEQKRYFSQASRVTSVTESDMSEGYSKGIVQVNVIQAKDLLAMDRNGLSDPFFEILIGEKNKCTSEVIKNNLNPAWKEQYDLEMPADEDTMEIMVWDHDRVMKNDFIGSVTFSRSRLINLASDSKFDGWLKLEKVERGWIQVRFKVFVQDEMEAEINSNPNPKDIKYDNNMAASSPRRYRRKSSGVNERRNTLMGVSESSSANTPTSSAHSPSFLDGSVKSMNESVIGVKIDEFNREFKSVSTLTLDSAPRFEGIRLEVKRIEGLLPSSKSVYCKVKLTNDVKKNRVLFCSPTFVPQEQLDVSFFFKVDNKRGERNDSEVSFKLKTGPFNTLCKIVVVLMDILPQEAKETRRSTLRHGNIVLHVTCNYQAVHTVH